MHFEIPFTGHVNIRSLHKNTIEITKEEHLTPSGDCIVGVGAKYACKDVPKNIIKKIRDPNSNIVFSINVNGYTFKINGKGHQDLICTDPNDIVLRKSNYVCPRTLAINCDKASNEIPRKLVQILQNPKTKGTLSIDIR